MKHTILFLAANPSLMDRLALDQEARSIGATIQRLEVDGFTILLVEQNIKFAQTVSDRHYVVEHGRVVDMVPNADLAGSMDRLRMYLGV